MSFKNLTKDDVKRVAIGLLSINGTATTKDVKDQLRAEDYFAKQAFISDMMATLCDEEGWKYTFNGTYREYSFDGQNAATSPATQSASQALASASGANPAQAVQPVINTFAKSYTTGDGQVISAKDRPAVGDWCVRDSMNLNDTLYFDGTVSKDRARYAYCKIKNVVFHNTRISRYK